MLKTPSMLLLFAVVCTITACEYLHEFFDDQWLNCVMFMLESAQVNQTNGRTLIPQQQEILLRFYFTFCNITS